MVSDLTGMVFGRWTVMAPAIPKADGKACFVCRCSCGTMQTNRRSDLLRGAVNQCRTCTDSAKRNRFTEKTAAKAVTVAFDRGPCPQNAMEVPVLGGFFAWVSPDDFEAVNQIRWIAYFSRTGTPYAQARVKTLGVNKTVYMHRLIMRASADQMVDHASCDGLDNRRENLRFVTASLNTVNTVRHRANKTGFKGVHYQKGVYRAAIMVDGVRHSLGSHRTATAAAQAYDCAAAQFFGAFARLNFPIVASA